MHQEEEKSLSGPLISSPGAARLVGYSSEQIRKAEDPYLQAGVPLMDRAAAGLADVVAEFMPSGPGRVLILAGSGNNGGDGLFAAARLAGAGHAVHVLPVMGALHPGGLAAAEEAGVQILSGNDAVLEMRALEQDVVVDAMLGTGSAGRAKLRGAPLAVVTELAQQLREGAGFYVVAADIPSGLDPDSGMALGPVLPATATATFAAPKAGLLLREGPSLSGQIRVIPIGIEEDLAKSEPVAVLNVP